MGKQREDFDKWHFEDWKVSNANDDSVEFAREIYNRVHSHNNTQFFRQREFKAWQQAQRVVVPDGFVLVPKEPTQKMIDAFPEVEYEDTYAGACSIWVDDHTLKIGYKAMIEAQEDST